MESIAFALVHVDTWKRNVSKCHGPLCLPSLLFHPRRAFLETVPTAHVPTAFRFARSRRPCKRRIETNLISRVLASRKTVQPTVEECSFNYRVGVIAPLDRRSYELPRAIALTMEPRQFAEPRQRFTSGNIGESTFAAKPSRRSGVNGSAVVFGQRRFAGIKGNESRGIKKQRGGSLGERFSSDGSADLFGRVE